MRANEKDDCGHSCFDAECQGGPDPLCPVHGMTPEEAYEAALKAADGTTVSYGGWCAPSVMSLDDPPAFTADMVREAVRRVEDDYHERARRGEL